MGRMAGGTWFRSLWRAQASAVSQNAVIGVLAFEIASLMSKVVHLWQSLTDKSISGLREEIAESIGVKKLVSEDDLYLGRLIYAEMIESIKHISKSVSRIAKKCDDPALQKFEALFEDLLALGVDPYSWKLTWKKMQRKVKRMARLIAANVSLYQEMEALGDFEQTLRRMKSNDVDPANVLDYQNKVVWKRHEVKNLQEMSLWNKSYDYVVKLLARAIFISFDRVKFAFGLQQIADIDPGKDSKALKNDLVAARRQSLSVLFHSSIHPSESGLPRFASGAIGMSSGNSNPVWKAKKSKDFYSGPLGVLNSKASTPREAAKKLGLFSGPLSKMTRSGPLFGVTKVRRGLWRGYGHSSVLEGRKPSSKHKHSYSVGPLKGSSTGRDTNGIEPYNAETNKDGCGDLSDISTSMVDGQISSFSSKSKILSAPPECLGSAGLALHYANLIIQIEKLVLSPHLIGLDARDDLYNMLPTSLRISLRSRLRPYAKSLDSLSYDTVLASEWSEAMTGILEWLAPLAHNMIRWQTERSYEQQNSVSRSNMLLVQTLFFANQEKTENLITELLVGLNYIWRFGRDINAKSLVESTNDRQFDVEYSDSKE